MKAHTIMAAFACVTALGALASRTNTLVNGASDWSSPSSYLDTSFVPGEGDTVLIATAATNYLYSTDSASLDVATNLATVIFRGRQYSSVLVVDVAKDATLELHCGARGYVGSNATAANGVLVKRGEGRLDLMRIGYSPHAYGTDYYTSFHVEEGTLRLPQTCNDSDPNIDIAREAARYCQIYHMRLDAGTTLIPTKYTPDNSGRGVTYAQSLSGDGTFQGHDTSPYWYVVRGTPYGPFAGKVINYVRFRVEANGVLELTGVENSGFKYPYIHYLNGGVFGAKKMGNKLSTSSSLGYTRTIRVQEAGGRFLYLGDEGETSNFDFEVVPTTNPFYLDAGAHGGLVLTGLITNRYDTTYPAKMREMVFTGSNSVPCVFAGPVESTSLFVGGVNYALYMAKEGSGTWRFSDNDGRANANGFAVREGTLQFDSLKEAGLICALGTSTNLTDGYRGAYDASRAVDYAFKLGGTAESGAANEPTFEYTGGTGVVCTTRPIALSGNAKIRNSTSRAFRFRGVSGLGAGSKTLTLDGTNAGQNEIADISDGTDGGRVGIAKTGLGTWRLSGDLTFSGDIDVKGGVLTVVNPATNLYSWYRWTIKKLVAESGANTSIEEFGLFDAGNLRQNVGLSVATNASEIVPGQAAFERPADSYTYVAQTSSSYPGSGELQNMFNHHQDYGLYIRNTFDGARQNWLPVTMRLTNGTPEIATFDFIYPFAAGAATAPEVYTVEGSLNGLNWDLLYTTNSAASVNASTFSWQGAGTGSVNRYFNQTTYVHAGGFPIRGHATRMFDVLRTVGAVSVSGNATFAVEGAPLTLSKLSIDCDAEGGSISNVTFTTGVGCELDVAKAGAFDSLRLPVTFDACENVAGITGWTLSVNGKPTRKRLVARDGSIYIVPPGFSVIVR